MAAAHREAEEKHILGVTVADPSVLKAVQVMLVSVAVGDFLLFAELTEAVQTRGPKGRSRFEEAAWAFALPGAVLMTAAGYLGLRRGSAWLLQLFAAQSALSASLFALMFAAAPTAEYIGPMQLSAAVLSAAGAHQSWFLRNKAREGSLFSARTGGPGREGYVMLGMPMIDLKVLWATQLLFTAQAIVLVCMSSLIISIVLASFKAMPKFATFIGSDLIFVSVTLALTSYCGIRKSHATLLGFYSLMCLSLACVTAIQLVHEIAVRGFQARFLVILGNGAAAGVSGCSGAYLARAVRDGKVLTAQEVFEGAEMTSALPPTQLGAPAGAA